MGKEPAIIGFSREQDFKDTGAAVAENKRRDHSGHPGARNTMAPPHLRWGKVVTTWADGDLNTVTVRPCFADGTAIPGVKTDGTHDLKIYIQWPADTDPGDMSAIFTADLLLPWIPFGVVLDEHYGLIFTLVGGPDIKVKVSANDTVSDFLSEKLVVNADKWLKLSQVNDGAEEDLLIEHIGPVAGAVDTIGVNTEGTEVAYADTYDATSSGNGVELYVMGRNGYYHAGDEKLYGYTRKITFDKLGHLQSIGAETRIEIDVPVVCP